MRDEEVSNQNEEQGRKKLVYITTRLFWPTDNGHKHKIYYYCQGLHERYGYDIYVYSFLDSGQTHSLLSKKPKFIKEVELAENISTGEKISNLLKYSLIFKKWPMQCSVFHSEGNVCAIRKYVEVVSPCWVIVDMIRLGTYYESIFDISCRKTIDIEDCLSLRYKRQSLIKSTATFNGAYQLPKAISIITAPFKNTILKFESKLVARYEKYCYNTYDNCILVSSKETDNLNKLYQGTKAHTVSLGVPNDYFDEKYNGIIKEPNTAVFVGNFTIAANIATLEMIVRKILPLIKKEVQLRVAGKCPSDITKKYSDVPNLKFLGYVDDLKAEIRKCSAVLAPIAYGSGIKTKIIEAMALGMPVVTNSVGVEGIEAENGVHLLIDDDYKLIAESVDRLISDTEFGSNLGLNARKLASEKYCWDTIWDAFMELEI